MNHDSLTLKSTKTLFLLDPDYANFIPGKTRLKFTTLYDSRIDLFAGIILFFFLPVFLLAVYSFIQGVLLEIEYGFESTITTAEVTHCQYDPPKDVGGKHSPGSITLDYGYSVVGLDSPLIDSAGQDVTGDADTKNCDDYPVGSTIQIQYLDNIPTKSRLLRGLLENISGLTIPVLIAIPTSASFLGPWSIIKRVRAWRWISKLQKEPQLLDGEIVDVRGELYKDWFRRRFYLTVTYQFLSPYGTVISRKQQKLREDLRDQPLPSAGTPVKVLYNSDACHVIL